MKDEMNMQNAPNYFQEFNKGEESAELNKLFEALAKAQLEMEIAKTDSLNPYFKSKYADLASVVKASRPVLAKNGICVIQRTMTNKDGKTYLYTRLCHASGQWIESNMEVRPPKTDIQALGSYLTYLRRYMYSALTGVVASEEEDDGEGAMKEVRTKNASPKKEKKAEQRTKEEIKELVSYLDDLPDYHEKINKFLQENNINTYSELPKHTYDIILKRAKEYQASEEEQLA